MKVLLVAVSVSGALALLLPMIRRGVTVAALLNAAAVLLIVAVPAAIVLLEDRRARSVILSESGVSALAWSIYPSFPFLALSRADISWHTLTELPAAG